MPDISLYAEYRHYLRDRYRAMRALDRKISHRYIAFRAGSRSGGWFADIVSGRQKLKPRKVAQVAAALKLEPKEAEYLQALVDIERAASPEDRVAAMERWMMLKGLRRETVDKDRFAFFDHWYHLALRELLGVMTFKGDYASLGAALAPPVGTARVRRALDLLQRLGLVQPQPWNRRSGDLSVLIKAPGVDVRHWNRILKSLSKLAISALDQYRKEERNFSGLTLCLSPEGLRMAGDEIAGLRKRLLALSEKDKAKNRVYQCLFQVFPLSKTVEATRD